MKFIKINEKISFTEKLDYFHNFFTTITKPEADFIEEVLQWTDETKITFLLSKRTFDDHQKDESKTSQKKTEPKLSQKDG